MNSSLQTTTRGLQPASQETLEKLAIVHQALRQVSDVRITTDHILHGGMYTRTIRLEAGVVMMGSLIKRPTILIVNGATLVMTGDQGEELEGYNVIPGSAGRKQLFLTRGPVKITMIFATEAKSLAEAEDEVFDEADELMSRKDGSGDTLTITGE
jgi:hypothetical protein